MASQTDLEPIDGETTDSDAVTLRDHDSPARDDVLAEQGYRGPDPETDPHGDGAGEDQGT